MRKLVSPSLAYSARNIKIIFRLLYTGDKMKAHDGYKFSTYDRDSDGWSAGNCPKARQGAWWYASCTDSNLNSFYDMFDKSNSDHSLGWDPMSIKFSEIKLRRK